MLSPAQRIKALIYTYYLIFFLDITQYDTFPNFAKKVESIVGPAGLNVLINNAAITVDNNNHLDNVKPDDFIRVYKNNVVGPIFLTKVNFIQFFLSLSTCLSVFTGSTYYHMVILSLPFSLQFAELLVKLI